MNNSSNIILENKLPLRPVTKWVQTWSGGFELEHIRALIGGIGDVGRAEKKEKNKNERRCRPPWYQNWLVRKRSPDTVGSTGIVYVFLVLTNSLFFFFFSLFASAVQPNLIPCCRCRANYYRATGNANEKKKNNNYSVLL